jgi:hypothetical protein
MGVAFMLYHGGRNVPREDIYQQNLARVTGLFEIAAISVNSDEHTAGEVEAAYLTPPNQIEIVFTKNIKGNTQRLASLIEVYSPDQTHRYQVAHVTKASSNSLLITLAESVSLAGATWVIAGDNVIFTGEDDWMLPVPAFMILAEPFEDPVIDVKITAQFRITQIDLVDAEEA